MAAGDQPTRLDDGRRAHDAEVCRRVRYPVRGTVSIGARAGADSASHGAPRHLGDRRFATARSSSPPSSASTRARGTSACSRRAARAGVEPDLGALVRVYWELQRVTGRADLRDSGVASRTSSGPAKPPEVARSSAPQIGRNDPSDRGQYDGPPVVAPPVRPSPRPLGVLDPRRGVPDPGARGEGGSGSRCPPSSLTDHGSLAGAVELYREARQARRQADHRLRGLRRRRPPRADEGLRAPDAPRRVERGLREPHQALARSATSRATTTSRASTGSSSSATRRGIVALSGCLSGRVSRALVRGAGRRTRARTSTASSRSSGATRRTSRSRTPGSPSSSEINPELIALAEETGLPLVATGDVHYLDADDAYAHEALLCIQSGDTLKNPAHWRFDTNEFFFKTPEEMAGDFPGLEHALARTLEVAERCNVEIELGRILLPTFPVPEGRDAFDYLVELCEKGLVRRYGKATPELTERLRFELKTIKEMGFADYFLIVWDFIHFAKQNGVSVGPGRGSSAGSLAAYCLEITDVDPMRYGLLFERFLNPARKDLPDMDIDFSVAGRDRVINYVAEKYGRDRVAQIITFSTMAARAAIRDAGPRARHPVRRRRPHREARARGPRPDARGRAQAGRRAPAGGRLGSGREGDHRPRAAARGADARRLDPRGGRRHRRAAADRGRPAPAEGRGPGGRHAGRDARRRRPRPPEDGLPRPAQPRRHRQGGRARRRRRHRHAPARRREDVRDARARRLDGRLPVRVVGHARGAALR